MVVTRMRTEEERTMTTTVKMIRQGLFALPLLALGACGGARQETRADQPMGMMAMAVATGSQVKSSGSPPYAPLTRTLRG